MLQGQETPKTETSTHKSRNPAMDYWDAFSKGKATHTVIDVSQTLQIVSVTKTLELPLNVDAAKQGARALE